MLETSNISSMPENGAVIGDTTSIEFSYNYNGEIFKTTYDIEIRNKLISNISPEEEALRKNICTWGGGTWDQIYGMVQMSKNDMINLKDYWKVGDEKFVYTNSMPITANEYIKDSKNPKYLVKLVIMDITKTFRKELYNEDNKYYGEVVFGAYQYTVNTYNNIITKTLSPVVLNNILQSSTEIDTITNSNNNLFGIQTYNFYQHIFGAAEYAYINRAFNFKQYNDISNDYFSSVNPKTYKMEDPMPREYILLIPSRVIKDTNGYINFQKFHHTSETETGNHKVQSGTMHINKTVLDNHSSYPKTYTFGGCSVNPFKEEIFGDNALPFFKIASNRIFKPNFFQNTFKLNAWYNIKDYGIEAIGIMLDDFTMFDFSFINDHPSFNVKLHIQKYGNGDAKSYNNRVETWYEFPDGNMPEIKQGYIDKNGEYKQINFWDSRQYWGKILLRCPLMVM